MNYLSMIHQPVLSTHNRKLNKDPVLFFYFFWLNLCKIPELEIHEIVFCFSPVRSFLKIKKQVYRHGVQCKKFVETGQVEAKRSGRP